jgi:hypothetical protein
LVKRISPNLLGEPMRIVLLLTAFSIVVYGQGSSKYQTTKQNDGITRPVQDKLNERLSVADYANVQSAINAASGKTLVFSPGVFTCENLTWGESSNIQLVLEQGADLTGCALPEGDSTHWIDDRREGGLESKLSSGEEGKGAGMVGFQAAGAGAVVRTLQDEARSRSLTPQQYGQGQSGVTDQQAFDAMLAIAKSTGKSIYLPAGEYDASIAVNLNGMRIYGDGDSTILNVPAGQVAVYNSSTTTAYRAGDISNLQIKLLGNGSMGIDVCGLGRWNIHDILFQFDEAFAAQTGIKGHCGYDSGGVEPALSSYNVRIHGNRFLGTTGAGYGAGSWGIYGFNAANGYKIYDNRFEAGLGTAIEFDGTLHAPNTARIFANDFNYNAPSGIAIHLGATDYVDDARITDNRFEGTGLAISLGAFAR